jgi:hydroxyacylglutathione hydrolase
MEVTNGVYAYPWTNMMENNCNTYVLKGERLILVDPGLKRYVPDIINSMKEDGLNPEDIELIINTHSHPDHIDGNTYFVDNNVKITMHEQAEKFLGSTGKEFFGMFGLDEPQYKADFYCNEGELNTSGISLQIIHSPGHSPGSVCIYWQEKEVLISGDVVFSGSIGRTDFPGGNGNTLKESIEKISPLKTKYLLPGHNEIVVGVDAIQKNFEFIKGAFFSYL